MGSIDGEVKLFGAWSSSFTKRVEIVLKMKGIKYENVAEDLSSKSCELLTYNPVHKKVPVLLHNGKPICESLLILEYIDETWTSAPSILPKDPYAKAIARFWAKFIDEKCFATIWRVGKTQGKEQEKAIEESIEHLKTLENELKDKKYFGGDDIGLVDIAANFIALWLQVFQELLGIKILTKEKLPRLSKWAEDYLNCSIIKETCPTKEDLSGYFCNMFRPSK